MDWSNYSSGASVVYLAAIPCLRLLAMPEGGQSLFIDAVRVSRLRFGV
jgi:hypothetical protein